ncbi:UNVERIFIED_CONTAM: hypothetical protein OHV15_18010, partial [Microbacterium sp. SLM126]
MAQFAVDDGAAHARQARQAVVDEDRVGTHAGHQLAAVAQARRARRIARHMVPRVGQAADAK